MGQLHDRKASLVATEHCSALEGSRGLSKKEAFNTQVPRREIHCITWWGSLLLMVFFFQRKKLK